MKRIRLLLADDHKVIRAGLRMLIAQQPDLRVIGEAADGREALAKARVLQPDIVLLDLSMPGVNGLQAANHLRAEQPQIKIIVLTAHDDENCLRQLCAAGVSGYVLKSCASEELVKAIRTVSDGGAYFDTLLASRALSRQGCKNGPSAGLSGREREVLTLLAWGYSHKEIASKLGVSAKTIETYKLRIVEKLNFRSRVDIVRYALRAGWLEEFSHWQTSL